MFKSRPQINQILEGARNYVIEDKVIEAEAKRRASICVTCPHIQKLNNLEIIRDNKIKTIEGHVCSSCGCALSLKTRSSGSDCPEGKW